MKEEVKSARFPVKPSELIREMKARAAKMVAKIKNKNPHSSS